MLIKHIKSVSSNPIVMLVSAAVAVMRKSWVTNTVLLSFYV